MNKVLRFNSHLLASLVLSVSLTTLSGTSYVFASESMDEVVVANESMADSLRFLKKSLEEYPGHRAELIVAALKTFAVDEDSQQRVIYVAREVFPDETTALVEELMLHSPDAVAPLRSAFLTDANTMRDSLAEVWGDEPATAGEEAPEERPLQVVDGEAEPAEPENDLLPAIRTAATFAMALDESMVDPATAVDTSFDLSASSRPVVPTLQAPSPEDPAKEVDRDQIKLGETSASADESSLNNSLEFDESNEGDLAKLPVRIDDAWKPSEDIYLDESKFEKRRLAAAQEAALEVPQERAELEFQSTVDHQAGGFGHPPLNLPLIGPEL